MSTYGGVRPLFKRVDFKHVMHVAESYIDVYRELDGSDGLAK